MENSLRTPQLDTQRTLKLAQNLRVRHRTPRLVVLDHRRLLVNLLRNILLRELQVLAGGLHGLQKGKYVSAKDILEGL